MHKPSTSLHGFRAFAAASSNIKAVKELREKSGAPISDVKAALEETKYDIGVRANHCGRAPSSLLEWY